MVLDGWMLRLVAGLEGRGEDHHSVSIITVVLGVSMDSEGLTLLNTETVTSGVRHLYGDTIMMQRDTAGQEEKKDTEVLAAAANKIELYSQCDSGRFGTELTQIYQNSCQIDFSEIGNTFRFPCRHICRNFLRCRITLNLVNL